MEILINILFIFLGNCQSFFFRLICIIFTLLIFDRVCADDDIRDFYILQTSDIHSNVFGEDSSWLREATVIEDIIKKNGRDNVLLIDCGDTLAGDFSGIATNGQIGIDMLNLLQYDVWVPGNHDFDFGLHAFYKFLSKIKASKLAANLNLPNYSFKGWQIFYKNGIKVAVIGMTYPWTDSLIWGESFRNIKLMKLVPTLDMIIPEIMKAKPDIIVLAAHYWLFAPKRLGGLSFQQIANKYPQIDIFLGGHIHKAVSGKRAGLRSWCVVPGAHSKSLAKVSIKFNIKKKCVQDITSVLLPVDSSIHIKPIYKNLILNKYKKKIRIMANQKISNFNISLKDKALDDLFAKAVCKYSNTKFAVISSPLEHSELNGVIRMIDIFNIAPYEDFIVVLFLTEKQLLDVLDEQNSVQRYKQAFFGGQVRDEHIFTLDGKRVFNSLKQRIPIAFSSYIVASADGRFPFLRTLSFQKDVKAYSTNIKIRVALKKYINKNAQVNNLLVH